MVMSIQKKQCCKSKETGVPMNNAVAVRQQSNEMSLTRSIPSEHEMMVYHTMAEQAITSKMYGNNYKDKSAVMMIMLSARELGIPPMQALNGGINIVQGKAEISARMMSALIRKSGHKIKVKECTEMRCILVGTRGDTGETEETSFSVTEAQTAGLVKPGGGWVKWPKDMCFARALSRLARQLFSDVIGIGYVEGEIHTSDVKPEVESVCYEEIVVEDENEFLQSFLSIFEKEERYLALEYLKVVQQHFQCDVIQAVKKLTQDKKVLIDQFHKWAEKNKKTEP